PGAQPNQGGRRMVGPGPGSPGIVAPSAVRDPVNGSRPRALRDDELQGVVESFAAAAARAQQAGFDGVQIHAAHGYLLSEFLTPHTNRRDDDYGGSLTNRMRLLLEVLTAIRRRVGDDFPVLAKLNGTDMLPLRRGATTDELVAVGVALQDAGLDAIEISRAHYESWPGMVLGKYKGFWRAQIREGHGQQASLPRKALGLAAGPLIERVAQRLAPASRSTATARRSGRARTPCCAALLPRRQKSDEYARSHDLGSVPGAPARGSAARRRARVLGRTARRAGPAPSAPGRVQPVPPLGDRPRILARHPQRRDHGRIVVADRRADRGAVLQPGLGAATPAAHARDLLRRA